MRTDCKPFTANGLTVMSGKRLTTAIMLMSLILAAGSPLTAGAQQGQSAPLLTLRTLAEVQQWQDEQRLQEKMDTLKQRRPPAYTARPLPDAAGSQTVSMPANPAGSAQTPVRKTAAPKRRKPALTLMSVYGPVNRLQAETLDKQGALQSLTERDRIGDWVVSHIRQEGVLLHKPGHRRTGSDGIFLAVGESMDEGERP